ncbi:MAG: MFS transporter [Candidatus Bathyarchaeota archaeon]|nr:MFS transporter [Candidatus Bathyarchaeota archaeon]
MLDWVNRDGKLLLAVRPLQSFAASYVSIFFAIYLKLLGLPLWQVGLVLTGGLLSSTLFNLIAGFLADKVGRRRVLVFFGLLTAASGLVFSLVSEPVVLVVVSVISTMGYRGGYGVAQMLERVILAQSCPDERRTRLYAVRSTLGSLASAAGSLFTGFLVVLQSWGVSEVGAYRWMFAIFTALNLVVVVLYLFLSEDAEIKQEQVVQVSLSPETKRYVVLFSVLFSMDSFGGAFMTQSLVAFWFFERFGLGMDFIGAIFSASSLLAAVSFMLAARISERIGLINTMVYSHLPASIMMAAIPYAPTMNVSLFLYLGRSLLSQMDVPTRQSYTMAIVKPEERSRVQGLINLPRSLTLAIGPSIAGYIMQFIGLSVPFLVAGGIKAVYDIALWFTFKDIKPPEENE